MTREIDNALLMHGGEDDISIPGSALQQIIDDALTPDCGDMISQLRLQNEALEEANKRVCDERDFYLGQCHAYEARLAGKVYD